MIFLYVGLLLISFAILFKCADYFVAGAVGIAQVTRIPKMVVGIVLVGLATTAPEFGVSVQAAFLGHPEIALGNAIGSVICDDGVERNVSIASQKNQHQEEEEKAHPLSLKISLLKKPIFLFIAGICGVILSSRIVIWASIRIAQHFSLSETVIGLTIIAIGTSLPEISTCITAARKGEGEIAVGDIIGADILNILWIIGVSSIVNPIKVDLEVINFTFPYMILIVTVMLVSMRLGCRLTKGKGILLLGLYGLYLFLTLKLFS